MKISYKHLIRSIPSKPSIEQISKKLFQLGHEHEIQNDIFDMEFTPNRGDCLSINGLLRDLSVFYEITSKQNHYDKDLRELDFSFTNNAIESCPAISFLKIDIEDNIDSYKGSLKSYFDNLDVGVKNFFTDVSNYISYETGQPTHCYDAKKIKNPISLESIDSDTEFLTLFDEQILLKDKNLVFVQNNEAINLAGVIGGANTSCNAETRSVIVECAYFNPEDIIGKSTKYDIKSDAAHKFERGVDPLCHEKVLRRFLSIIEEHALIKDVAIFSKRYKEFSPSRIYFDVEGINKILGTSCKTNEFNDYLYKLGFKIEEKNIVVPSYRPDIKIKNDIAEEMARVIGYNKIEPNFLSIDTSPIVDEQKQKEKSIKDFLIQKGFFEVINNPFINQKLNNSIKVDNPLDSNRSNLRTHLEDSLIENLLYNERRQKDSIKLFEISEIYQQGKNDVEVKKMLGIICSGRLGKNYLEFSKKIDKKYLGTILSEFNPSIDFSPKNISREKLDTKIKNEIVFIELDLDDLNNIILDNVSDKDINFFKYSPISEFPSSTRDLSFSIKNLDSYTKIQKILLNYKHDLLKEVFIFDFYNNENIHEIKIGFRFLFQSKKSTITENQVNDIMSDIIKSALSLESVEIPGLT